MNTFAEAATQVSATRVQAADIAQALKVLGDEAAWPLPKVPPIRRAELVDRYVRNLRTLAVRSATLLQRELLMVVHAEPDPQWEGPLRGPVSLIELRNRLKHALTIIGLDWDRLTKVQSCACGLARWVQDYGGGSVSIQMQSHEARCRIRCGAQGADLALVEQSPMVSALRAVVRDFRVDRIGTQLEFAFAVSA